jgi:hypothetical protein
MAPILVSLVRPAGVWPHVLPEILEILAALGRSRPVLELKDALAGRRSTATPQSGCGTTGSAFLLIQAAGTRRPHRSVDLVSEANIRSEAV